jgi:hypothetical protein
MTKEIPMTNVESAGRSGEFFLSFELRHSLVIRASSLVVQPLFFAEKFNPPKP